MIYRTFHDKQISQLGMGVMRLPTLGERGPIDEPKAREIIEYLYESGVNYFDSAYVYHNGESERFIGQALSQYPRETWYLATKMPGFMMQIRDGRMEPPPFMAGANVSSPRAIFETQLERCGVEYIDFYLLHNLCETSLDVYMNEDVGIVPYLLEEKKAGRIRHLGFSAHGRADTIERYLDWGNCFDFVQIQLNYLDWTLQNARAKYEMLAKRGIPVMVMEPCRGGRLASLNPELTAMLKAARPDDSIASWAFRFAKSPPGVQVVLSGMTQIDQAIDNVRTFSDPSPMSDEDKSLLDKVFSTMVDLVPCTACEYCRESCPQGLNIPQLIALYNEMSFDHTPNTFFAIAALSEADRPERCITCGECARLCPQNIAIPETLKALTQAIANRPVRMPPPPPPAARA